MERKRIAIIAAIAGIIVFGYIQYASAQQIRVVITDSKLVEKTDQGSLYDLKLKFDNPSLLFLNAGKTQFTITADEQTLGGGALDPFLLPALGNAITSGTFLKDHNTDSDNPQVKITGVTKYELLVASIDVPFTYYPTADQTREFIHGS